MPHSSFTPVSAIFFSALSTMCSRLRTDSTSESVYGAMSTSWKQKNGTPSFAKNSNAASIFCSAARSGSEASLIHGRSKVPKPKMSFPAQLNECQ